MKVVAYLFVGFVDGAGNPCQNFLWKDLQGKPVLLHIIDRLKMSKRITEIIPYSHLAKEEDKKALELAEREDLKLYFLKTDRWESMLEFQKNIGVGENDIVIFPINSPLVDPGLIDSFIKRFESLNIDYLWTEDFPVGIGTELWKADIWYEFCEIDPKGEFLRTGGHHSFAKTSTLFKKDCVKAEGIWNKSELNFRVDLISQLHLLRKIYKKFYRSDEIVSTKEVLSFYEQDPDWFKFLPESQLEIEVTNDCNLKCIMCPRAEKMIRKIGYMDFDLFKKIVDKLKTLSIHFSGFGEPLLHPRIIDMFSYAKEKGLEVGLWTNGVNLNKSLSKEIIEGELLDYIIFSLDAATRETYFKIKGVDVFEEVRENILKFLEIKSNILKDKSKYCMSRKPLVGIQILKMKNNEAEIEQFMEEWDYVGRIKKMISYQTRIQKGEAVEAEVWKMLYEKFPPVEHAIIGHFNNYCGLIEDRSVIDVTPLKRFPCRQLEAGLSVLWNGDVILCHQDFDGRYSLGNLKDQNLEEILEGERLKDIWQVHKDGEYEKLPLCKDCKEWYYNLYA